MDTLHHAEKPDQLAPLPDMLNGAWFNLEDLRFNQDTGELTIPSRGDAPRRVARVASLSRATGTGPELVLVIANVLAYDVKDKQSVGIYDLNSLIYNARTNCIQITGVSPFP